METEIDDLNGDKFDSPLDELLDTEDVEPAEVAKDRLEKAMDALEGRVEPVTAFQYVSEAYYALGGEK